MKRWLTERRRRRAMARAHRDPVPDRMFRMMVLDDNPTPTYIGYRSWCSGTPFWRDGTCRCTHTEKAPS
ncbi:hypothetical protein PBI_SMARTIES_86 [Microbacterium phage Smarties]|uniref:Uncharacterized protein n=1 Tax=Microbacterium phage Ariadne TaxID=2656546 RepID=A0A649VBJ0_9CAUD|nr:hypothetical protein QDA10_gp086 [Microbacterium phage Ariadne]QGJ89489.1 hypothetical protein PBI_ARIADNE_86 [Microbacterium phage Ariadne]QGJ91476.1 hypothetical protein PBI_SMARTIES_86 [Microbacterium phage Smarties]